MRDNPPPYLRHTAWSGILQRFFALALVLIRVMLVAFNFTSVTKFICKILQQNSRSQYLRAVSFC